MYKIFYSFETEDGIKVDASGSQKQVGHEPENVGTVAKGSYSYTTPDGTNITVTWIADENGFQPIGDHLPTPPPVPEHFIKTLAELKDAESNNRMYQHSSSDEMQMYYH